LHALAPQLPTVLLLDRVPLRLRDGSLPLQVTVVGPSLGILKAHPRYVERVHAHGGQVHVWTVDAVADIAAVLELDVDAVISNEPRRVLAQLGRV